MRLKFSPHQTLQAAARIAHEHGYELRLAWNGKQAVVEAVRPVDKISQYLPAFLRMQGD